MKFLIFAIALLLSTPAWGGTISYEVGPGKYCANNCFDGPETGVITGGSLVYTSPNTLELVLTGTINYSKTFTSIEREAITDDTTTWVAGVDRVNGVLVAGYLFGAGNGFGGFDDTWYVFSLGNEVRVNAPTSMGLFMVGAFGLLVYGNKR